MNAYPEHTCVARSVSLFTVGKSYSFRDNSGLVQVTADDGTNWSLAEVVLDGYASFVPTAEYATWLATARKPVGIVTRIKRRLVEALS